MSREVWSKIEWQLLDIMEQYGVSEDKAGDIAFTIASDFEDRMVELGWDVIDSLIQTFNLLDDKEEDV
jgi:hypothetical protein